MLYVTVTFHVTMTIRTRSTTGYSVGIGDPSSLYSYEIFPTG